MKTFDWEKFKYTDIAVHCDTENKANDFLKQAYKHGFEWNKAGSLLEENCYSKYGTDTCYRTWDDCAKELVYNSVRYYQKNNYQIIEWSDYMEFTNGELRVGMLVETSFGKGIVMPSHSESVVVESGGSWCSLDFEDVEKVWDYPDDPHFTLDCTGRHRRLLYERPTAKEMTVEEISKALGCDVKIVKG